jgi:tryptophan halogenase
MNGAVRELVVVGRDAPVWLAACVMQSALGPAGLRVTVVELPDATRPADVYATLPALEPLHARLRIEEARLIAATRGAFTLGKRFQDTTGAAPAFFHAYGSTGARIDNTEFLPNWIKARHYGLPVAFEDFCLTAAAAKHGRMLVPDAEVERFGFTDYGYHLPAIPYAAWLRQLAVHRGTVRHETKAIEVLMTTGGSDIAGLLLEDGRRVMGDFFIDATGAGALLLAGKLEVARESWRDAFPCGPCGSRLGRTRSAGAVPTHLRGRACRRERLACAAAEPGLHACRPCLVERKRERSRHRGCTTPRTVRIAGC